MKAALVRRARPFSALCALGACLAPSAAQAAGDRFSAEAFEPVTTQDSSLLSVYGTRTLAPGSYSLGPMLSYARRPVALRDGQNGDDLGDLVGSISTFSLLGSIGIVHRFDLGVAVPLHRVSAGSEFGNASLPAVEAALVEDNRMVLGDLRLVPRVSIIEREPDSGLGLAALLPISLPTGNEAVYGGEGLRVQPRLAADWMKSGVLVAANVGYLIREQAIVLDSKVDDMLRWGLGAEIPVWSVFSGLVEASGAVNLLSDDFSSNDAPTEGLLGVRMRAASWLAQIAGGPGMVHGLTAPQYRLLASIGFAADLKQPDIDSDGDGLLDSLDQCPTRAEDLDSFQDLDGCPDLDNDSDGALDAQDRCPAEAEDQDGFQDQDGCPDLDNDQDQVLDAADACPNEAEDLDGFQDEDGCPDLDNDQDQIPDRDDRCPDEPGVAAEQGCKAADPAPAPGLVQVSGDHIELGETVFFETNSAEIQLQSQPLLDELAQVLTQHSEITLIVVEGHTDDLGARQLNAALSQSRAEAVVKALVTRGVEGSRLRAQGFGPDRPLVPNDGPENRKKNRRVELRIEQRVQ